MPAQHARFRVGQVDLVCVVRAALARLTVAAARGGVRRGVFFAEVGQRAERGHARAPLAQQPQQDVQVVAALLQDHRAGVLLAPPVAAHKAVRLVPVDHVFQRLDRHDPADASRVDHFLDLLKERRVAQHVTDDHLALRLLGGLQHALALGEHGRDGLFHQDVIALLQRGDGVADMLAVLRAHEQHVRQAGLSEHFLGAGKAALRRHAIGLGHIGDLFGHDVRDGDDLHQVRTRQGHGRIGVLAAPTQARDGDGDGLLHKNSSWLCDIQDRRYVHYSISP